MLFKQSLHVGKKRFFKFSDIIKSAHFLNNGKMSLRKTVLNYGFVFHFVKMLNFQKNCFFFKCNQCMRHAACAMHIVMAKVKHPYEFMKFRLFKN